jgi:hypothetical protein
MSGVTTYDRIGVNYGHTRRPDPRIAAAIHHALGDASTVINVAPAPARTSRRRPCWRWSPAP